jgi:protein kinase C substrate 80K-H
MRGRCGPLLGLALIAAWAAVASAAVGHVRGLRPELASKYEPGPGGKWTCLDGSRELDFTQVNDDFCHCPDGSDEPGKRGRVWKQRRA